ncbi:MAG: cupin domain-containing protein [Acidobacteria bacterium]|nr:cupin domain-containing protein [Acidobacteriota bacterium]
MTAITADRLIRMLGLVPHPAEGGYFRETYRAPLPIPAEVLPAGYGGARSARRDAPARTGRESGGARAGQRRGRISGANRVVGAGEG